jgi:hypothetical protein
MSFPFHKARTPSDQGVETDANTHSKWTASEQSKAHAILRRLNTSSSVPVRGRHAWLSVCVLCAL